jgi:periplasmic protein TonB
VGGRRKKRNTTPIIVVGLCITGVAGGAVALVRSFLNSPPGQPKQVVQEIHLIRPPPPPPDVPPPPPPPEEKVDVQEPQKQPDPTPSNEPPPSEHLGLDAEGGAGSDAFGLLGNKGGRDLVGSGGSAYVWYAGVLKNDILSLLQDDPAIRKGSYRVSVKLWLRNDGSVERFRLAQSTGDQARDRALEKKLSELTRISQAPPADTPEPITVEITTSG